MKNPTDRDRLNNVSSGATKDMVANLLVAIDNSAGKGDPDGPTVMVALALSLLEISNALKVPVQDVLRVAGNMSDHIREIPWNSELRAVFAFAKDHMAGTR